jgi:RNA polymerase sigma factor (sigma-70 family)
MTVLRRNQGVDHEQPEDFAAFYAATRDGCLRAICATVGDPELAEELVAEAFAKAFAHWRKLRRHPAPQAWVIRVALNTHVTWWRKRRREVAWDMDDPAHDRATAEGDASGPQTLDDGTMAALLALPRRQREVVALRVFLDLDNYYTAQALGISPKTASTHLARAISALRVSLATEADRDRISS